MKQTNNAIKFLMAQYRAIFKSAYFKGLATAVILTAGLAAGQSQAASTDDPFWTWDDSSPDWTEQKAKLDPIAGTTRVAGDYDNGEATDHNDGIVSGAGLIIGSGDVADLETLSSGSAYGGYVSLKDSSSLNALAEHNALIIKSGGEVNKASGDANLVGGWAKTAGNGTATANNNEVNIQEGAKLTLAGQIMGAWASSKNGASATENKVIVSGGDRRIAFTKSKNIFGAQVYVDKGANGGNYVAQNNNIDVSSADFDATSAEGKWIVSGQVHNTGSTGKADKLASVGNNIHLNDVNFGTQADTNVGLIAANMAQNALSQSVAQVIADGSDKTGLVIENSTIYSNSILGGWAQNKSGGETSASNNNITISNTEILLNSNSNVSAITGGLAESTKDDTAHKLTLNTSSNTVTIKNTGTGIKSVAADIRGAAAVASGSGGDNLSGSTITANNNTVTIGEKVKVTKGNVYGAYIGTNQGTFSSGGAIITASNNTVVIDGEFEADSVLNIAAVMAEKGHANMQNNSVVINGKVSNANFIYGAFASEQTKAAGDPVNVLTGNSVTISADAEIVSSKIWAAHSANTAAQAFNNDVTIDGKVTNSDIYGGNGADSAITLNASGILTYNSDTASTENIIGSDVVNLAGTVSVGANDILKIRGYAVDGNANNVMYNTNKTTVESTANILNKGQINLFGETTVAEGASLHALTAGADIVVDGDKSGSVIDKNVTDNDIDMELVGGNGALKIYQASLQSYLKSGDAWVNGQDSGTDVAGAVQITKGGVLEFADTNSVVLSNYAFSNTAKDDAGKIVVDSTLDTSSGSVIRANDLVVEHALVTDTNKSGDALLDSSNHLGTNGIQLEAKNLTLGSSSLIEGATKHQTQDIKFDNAVVSDKVTFVSAKDDNGNATPFQLTTNINLSDYETVYPNNDTTLAPIYHKPLSGVKEGDVKLYSGGSLSVLNGNWVASDAVILASGGAINVGNSDTSINKSDATLVLEDGLTVAVGSTGTADITVTGHNSTDYDFEENADRLAQYNYGDYEYLSQLDLRAGIIRSKDNKGTTTITAENAGVVLLDGNNLSTVLADNFDNTNKGTVIFSGSNGGKFIATGDVAADFDSFGANGINLADTTAVLEADTLTLTHKDTQSGTVEDTNYSGSVALGGTVRVKDLSIEDSTVVTGKPATASNTYASNVVVKSGKMEVSNSFYTVNDTITLGDTTGSAELVLDADTFDHKGSVTVNNLKVASGAVSVLNGNWAADNTTLTLADNSKLFVGGNGEDDINGDDTSASFTAKKLVTGKTSLVQIASDGSATFTTADLSQLDKVAGTAGNYTNGVIVRGDLTIIGDSKLTDTDGKDIANNGLTFGAEGSILVENNGHLTFGQAATDGAILADNVTSSATSVTMQTGYNKIAVAGGTVELGLTKSVFSADAIKDLKEKMFTTDSFNPDGTLKSGGMLNIGDATFNGLEGKIKDDGDGTYTANWSDIKGWSDITSNQDVTNNQLGKTNVTGVGVSDEFRGHYGSITMTGSLASTAQVIIAGDTSLRFAEGNNGYFIATSGQNAAAGANIQTGKTLRLIDGGAIGNVTLQPGVANLNGDTSRDYTTLRIEGQGETTIDSISGIAGDTNGTLVSVLASTKVNGDIKNIDSVEVENAALSAANINVNELDVWGDAANVTADTGVVNSIDIIGGKAAIKDLTITANNNEVSGIYGGGTLTATTLTMGDATNTETLYVGVDKSLLSAKEQESVKTGTGYLEVGTLDLNNSILFVDPEYGEATSLAAVKTFKDKGASLNITANDLGIVDGDIVIGKNAAAGIGANLEELKEAIASFQTNGSLSENKYGSILYLNGQLEIADGKRIALDGTATNKDVGDVQDASLRYPNSAVSGQYLTADFGLGDHTALVLSEKAFEDQDGNKTESAVHFNKKGAVVNSNGGDIVLRGSFNTAEKLNFFTDDDAKVGESGSGIKLVGQDINVFTQNGFMFGVIKVGDDVGYNVQLQVDKDKAYNIMSEASNPVVESMIAYGNRGVVSTDKPEDTTPPSDGTTKAADTTADNSVAWTEVKPAETTQPETPVTGIKGGSDFLDQVITTTNGAPAEQAARLAVYGGAAQAALSAISTSSDAVAARMGTGTDAGLTVANNGMGGALWLAPVYRNQDSDGFAAQGLEYGVDLNLYGLALGGDYTINNAITVGAMFNLGSGDADGQGNTAAAGVSNDFDYYGFSIYGGYRMGALNLSADFGFTSVDSDIEANNSLAKLTTSADSKVWTLGVTGKYAMTFNGVEVAPHAGLRFTSIDLDDYTIKADGADVAAYDADKLNVFSIPVGVTIAREFEGETWTVKPSFDLTLTGQFGDDEAEGTVSWNGVEGLKTNVSSEVFDNFTYGATVGVAAQTGNFSLGFGLNYTGSSNVDEFGVNANARYVF